MGNLLNIWLQIAVGLLPVVIVSLILLFTKKVGKMAYITLTLGITLLFATCSFLGVSQILEPEKTETVGTVAAKKQISKEDLIDIAYSFARNGDTDRALLVVDAYSDIYGYDDSCTLLTARINVLKGRFEAAYGAYRKLYAGNLPAEAQAVEKIVACSRVDMVLADRLAESGYEQPLLCSEEELFQLQNGGASELVLAAIEQESIDDVLDQGASWIIRANNCFDEYLLDDIYNETLMKGLLEEAEELESDSVFGMLEMFREARLKILLILGDFESIVSYLNEYAGCAEYMTVLELYLSGLAEKSDISKALDLEIVDGIDLIADQLTEILEDGRDSLPDQDQQTLEDQIAMLKSYQKDIVLYTIEDNLRDAVENPDHYRMQSKIYMALSKVCSMREDTLRSNQYFTEALLTAPSSNDGEYNDAMRELSQVISGEGGDELLKKLPDNAQKAVENSYWIPGTGKLIRNDEAESEIVDNVQQQTIKYSAAVTINSVDVSNFETVVLKVQLSDEMISERELKNLIRLNDCNYDITNFKIEKVDYEKANIILCCDNSGSMSGSIGSLRNAVRKFLEDSHEKERIGFYTFDDEIIQSLPLGATPEELENAISKMDDLGGTSIYNTLSTILSSASYDKDANQVIILMTDGQDGDRPTQDDIDQNIGAVAARKGYVVYVLGMGDSINSTYLSNIASSAGGRFIYAPSDAQLESLYQFIHGTLEDQYKITFTAKDTLTSTGRKVTVALDQKDIQNWKIYSVTDEDAKNASVDFDQNVAVFGLRERVVQNKKGEMEVSVLGTGFTQSDYMTLTFIGERTYSVTASYVSGTEFRAYLPESMAEGEYNMEVFLSGRRALYLNELIVVEGEPDELIFGGYHFTAYKIVETGSGYDLSRMVVMNKWLNFNGAISLHGDLKGTEMTLLDNSGSYIDYSDVADTHGYASYLKEKGYKLSIPALGSLKIYSAIASNGEYPTVEHDFGFMEFWDLLNVNHFKLRLYPDKITLFLGSGETKLPMQDFFVSVYTGQSSLFKTDFNLTGTITGHNIDISGKLTYGELKEGTVQSVLVADFLGTRTEVQKDRLEFEINTLTEFYKLGFNVKVPTFDVWVGASFWLENGGFDGFTLRLDADFTSTICGIPITLSDFEVGIDNLSALKKSLSPAAFENIELLGTMKASAYKASAVFKPLEKLVGDTSLLDLKLAIKTKFNKFLDFQGTATLSMLDLLQLAQLELKVGEFSHTDYLLGWTNTNVTGLQLTIALGVKVDAHNFLLDFSACQATFSLTDKIIGISAAGGVNMQLDWWVIEKNFDFHGKTFFGFIEENGKKQFTVRSSNEENGKRNGVFFYISEDGEKEYDLSYKY